jgi:predicted metal-dependent hydrolase
MKKGDRIEAFVESLRVDDASGLPACYVGYFHCFNAGQYYEAHDVLEHLWLQRNDGNHAFYKGLIQFAGAFVHLQKQYRRPDHPTDGRRMRPAVRLFALALKNLSHYPATHMGLDVARVREMCHDLSDRIKASAYALNPWKPDSGPLLELPT